MPGTDLPEFTAESATMTEEQLKATIEGLGYDNIQTSSESDQPEPEPVVDPKPEVLPETTETTDPETPAAGEAAGDDEPPPAGEPPAKKKPGSARLKERALHAESESRRVLAENEDLKRRLAEKPAGAVEVPKPPAVEPPKVEAKAAEVRPKPDDFEQGVYDPAYVEAVADWKYKENKRIDLEAENTRKASEDLAAKSRLDSDAKATADAELKAETDRWNASVVTAKDRFGDYDTVMNTVRTVAPAPALVIAVRGREDVGSAELAYWLVTHPEDEARLTALAKDLPAKPTQRQFNSVVGKMDRALDGIVEALQAYEPPDPEAAEEDEPAPPASREARAAAASPAPKAEVHLAPPAKRSPQVAPPATPVQPAKPKPAVPSTVGSRGPTTARSVMERAQRGEAVDPDAYRAEWERKHGALPL